jgi:glycogen debranching enzyme
MTAGTGERDRREWLETNGLGGYAMSTVTGENTRRYHGLLVAATRPPVGRMVLLSKVEETLLVNGRRIDLSTNCFPGTTHPEGFRFLTGFCIDPFPTFKWEADGVVVEKEVFMPHGENAVCVTWRLLKGEGPVGLEVRPLVAFRDFHALTHENATLDRRVDIAGGRAAITPYAGLPTLHVAHDGIAAQVGDWYRFFEYEEEKARGFDNREDLWHPFSVSFSFTFEETPGAARPEAPREGKPVEIQALWFNALRTMSVFARRIGEEDSLNGYRARAEACRASFLSVFPDEGEGRGLVDCFDGTFRDRSVRPNQLFAVSLHHSMVPEPLARSVLATAEEHLLTPYGLRTLSPKDPAYRGRYEGRLDERDAAYHQGTVWPWLLGAYATAFCRVNGDGGPAGSRAVHDLFQRLNRFLLGDGLGQVPEIFDGDAPHHPRGCVAQAWSVAELLRVADAARVGRRE